VDGPLTKETHVLTFSSVVSLVFSLSAFIMALRSDSHARKSVRPFVTTGVHLAPDDMAVWLSNYGAGVAIISKISMSRGGTPPSRSMMPLLNIGRKYEVQRFIDFVQDVYYLRPGDRLPMVTAEKQSKSHIDEALSDWKNDLEGISIEIEYSDIFGKHFRYERVISLGEAA
jgi:hypothetical protein